MTVGIVNVVCKRMNSLFFAVFFYCLIFSMIDITEQSKCDTCKSIVEKFSEGLKKTAKSNFGGGNTRWEEKSLGTYAFSETRLLEILENVCSSTECHTMLEEHEENIENWWFKHYAKKKDTLLHDYLCVDRLKNGCCPKGKYGPRCEDCAGGADNPCHGDGKCNGDGTREGTGKCECNAGYKGDTCEECAENYLQQSQTNGKVQCVACHESCLDGCTETGSQGCNNCKKGWEESEDNGCTDINECELETNPCPEHQFCSNTEGSYECTNCNIACKGCTSSGPENCSECADKFYAHENTCKACHQSCADSCTGAGPQQCSACKDGWLMDDNNVCKDIDECAGDVCEENKYCVNTQGSFRCNNCHSSCDGCTGTGSKNCKQCKQGYKPDENNTCVDEDECLASHVCSENEICVNSEGSYTCDCKKGFVRKGGECIKKVESKKTKENVLSTKYKGPADCETCTEIINKVFKGIDATEGHNFGGGNTKWEEEKIGSYLTSETRLTEVIEQICSEESSSKQKKCAHMVERYEEILEKWWFENFVKKIDVDLFSHLCINVAEICCPKGTFGASCQECPGSAENPCYGRGHCDGDGKREGTGKCSCDPAYNGTDCNICSNQYFEETRNESHLVCSVCDASCSFEDGCYYSGPHGCKVCKVGYTRDNEIGCVDNNECETDTPCKADVEYCENTPGSYKCNKCDNTCSGGCTGSGPENCNQCKDRHFRDEEDNKCKSCDRRCKKGCTGKARLCIGQAPRDYVCDRACKSKCNGVGREHCLEDCRHGYIYTEGEGCQDVNECEDGKHRCSDGKFCENTPGHFLCKKCKEHCKKCVEAELCKECDEGFWLSSDHGCLDIDECTTNPCDEDKICDNTVGSYSCKCQDGFIEDHDKKCVSIISTDEKEEL